LLLFERWVLRRNIDLLQRHCRLILGFEVVVVLNQEVDELVPVDECDSLFGVPSSVPGPAGKAAS
jgi:hypothetical protein